MLARLFLILTCLLSTSVTALEYRVDVGEPSLFDVENSIENVIIGAAEKMTGVPQSQMMGQAPDLFSLSEALVNSYGYDGNFFIVDIDVIGLKTRLETAGIDLWESERPEFLIWATEERGLERLMIGQEPNRIVERLMAASGRFGVPMRRPLMDLEDTLALSPAEIWGEFAGAVNNASSRYGIKHVLVIGDRPERQSMKYWFFESNGEFRSGEVSGADADERSDKLISVVMQYARSISDNGRKIPAVVARPAESSVLFQPQIQDVTGQWAVRVEYTDVIRLMELIDHIEASESVTIHATEIRANDATIVLKTDLSLGVTDQLVSDFSAVQFISPLVYSLK
ncbi:MAG TPA: hypothetical protein DEF72_01705 [Gammaproteobacteria bacterium]|nr:hypothetical protein [Gammaproteobacteria bacterium]|tara:strand:- start:409 stop:1428 length:1020 start_codon:yes stop_codon:yes gene_type:complete